MHFSIFLKASAVSAAIILSLSSCYRMPNEDDYSVVPLTNNRDFTREGNSTLMPNMEY